MILVHVLRDFATLLTGGGCSATLCPYLLKASQLTGQWPADTHYRVDRSATAPLEAWPTRFKMGRVHINWVIFA